MKVLTLLLILVSFTGCTTSVQMATGPEYRSKFVDEKNYEIGTSERSYVGEPIIVRKAYSATLFLDRVRVLNDFVLSGGIATTKVHEVGQRGDLYQVVGVNERGNRSIQIPNSVFMFGLDAQGYWDQTIASPSFWTSPVGSGVSYKIEPSDTKFQIAEVEVPDSSEGYINHELIFTGLGAEGIHLLYREYTIENMARQAFSQDLVYPIDSKTIRFRNYEIDLLRVDSSEISYTILAE